MDRGFELGPKWYVQPNIIVKLWHPRILAGLKDRDVEIGIPRTCGCVRIQTRFKSFRRPGAVN